MAGEAISGVERSAAVGFAAGADTYLRGRPSYPAAVVDAYLARVSAGVTADVGAGTGAMTVLLAARGVPVIAVDPVREMLAALGSVVPRAVATAQSLPWPSGALAGVMVANAFHWFATREALTELHRCLRPDGILALAWNERDESVPWVRRQSEIVNVHEGGTPRFKTMQWKDVVDAESAFTEIDYLEVANPTPMTADRLVDRVLSTSFIASLPDQPRNEVERQVRELAVSLPATFDYPYVSRLWLYQAT